jgi:putative ABC transport system permease protein
VIGVALKGLAGRKFRATLTAIAIVLGVAMISGTYVLTDTIDKAFSQIFDDSYAGTDAVVTGKGADISFQGDTAETPPIPADVLQKVRALPDVELAMGGIYNQFDTKILDSDGKAINTQGAPSLGFGIDTSAQYARFNPLNLVAGRWPSAPEEAVIDQGTADKQGYEVGDRVLISTIRPKQAFTLTGIAKYGEVGSLGTATFAVFDLETAQRLLDREGQFDAISVAAKPGVAAQELVSEIRPILPPEAKVQTGQNEAQEQKDEISEFTKFIEYFLLAFAAIALFVGAFVIFNTLSITVAQRTREFATLRTIGASRRQVLGSVVLEALTIGTIASVIGLFAGLGLAKGLNWLFEVLNLDLPTTGTVFATRTIVVSLLVGILITLLAGLFPAIRATRVPPIAAVREGATLPKSRLSAFAPFIAIVAIAAALALLGYAMYTDELATGTRLLSIAGGVLLLFVGVAMISSRAVPVLSRLVSPLGRWLMLAFSVVFYPVVLSHWLLTAALLGYRGAGPGRRSLFGVAGLVLAAVVAAVSFGLGTVLGDVPLVGAGLAVLAFVLGVAALAAVVAAAVGSALKGLNVLELEWPPAVPGVRFEPASTSLASGNSRRNPGRTAATAAALMIGIALVTFVATLANGMKASNRGAIEDQVTADYVVTSQDGFTPVVADAGRALELTPGTELVTSVRAEVGKLAGASGYVTGIEPRRIDSVYRFDWKEGSDAVLLELGENGAIVDSDFAEEHDLAVGDTATLLSASNRTLEVEIKGIYEPPPFYPILGSVSIPQLAYDQLYDRPRNQFTFVNVPGEPNAAESENLEAAVAGYPDAKVQTREQWIDKQDQDFNQFLIMLYVLLALSVIVSVFGMVNTLVLSVFERTRELGMLRAVGMTRRQVRRMVRHESVITALIGAALGLPLGIFLAALVTRALQEFDVRFEVPGGQLILFAVVAVVVGIAAAIVPARRAARLNVLHALQYE